MSTYINKIWWYKPNNYTTSFTLTATFEDDEVEYPFRKSEGNWERVGEHDSRIAIIMPSEDNGNRFIVRSYDDDPFIDLNATYANATSLTSAREVTLKRIVFDKTFFDNELFFANSGEDNPWDLFDDNDLGDMYLTNITTNITLPNALSANADWYGWGLFNETVPAAELEPADSDYYKIPLSWEYGKAMQGFPEVSTTQSSASHPDLSRVIDAPAVNNTYKMVPLYNTNDDKYWAIDTEEYEPSPSPSTGEYMYFEAVEANSTVSLTSTLATAPNLEYSTDGVIWQEWQHITADGAHTFDTITLGAVGDKVWLRGDNPEGLGFMPEGAEMPLFSHFDMTGKIAAGGNIMSLLDKDAEMTEIPEFGFFLLFGDITGENPNTSLTSAAAMPVVTTIGEYGCGYMYAGCTSITEAADMPVVTTIGDNGCASMYEGCSALTSAAAMPVVTTIGDNGCASMYEGCSALTSAAAMPAVTSIGEGGCGGMYEDCTFNMSNDGTTLNFDFPTPPVTAGETTYNTYYDVADWMGNTNGFTNP